MGIKTNQIVTIPDKVSVKLNGRNVTVKGPRGVLKRNFKHMAVDIKLSGKNKIIVEKWFGIHKELAAVRPVCSHIETPFTGVTKGYKYKMRSVYAHFPINVAISEANTMVEIRNFLGEKFT